jgi:uncharacterized protein (DUF1499 family)
LGRNFKVTIGRAAWEAISATCMRTIRNTILVYKHSVRTSQETHYVSATELNRLMLFVETVAVYCESHMEHTDTVRTSHETNYISATETNRLMLFRETVALYCESHTQHTYTVCT